MFRPAPASASVDRARRLLLGAFALSGFMIFSWFARIPTVRDRLGLTTVELGLLLLIGSIGALVAVVSSGPLLSRLGSRRVFAAGAVTMSTGYALMGLGPSLDSLEVFVSGIVLNGMGAALLNVAMNVESARIEQACGRTVIPHFHAAFSAGAVVGSIAGAGGSSAGVPLVLQFAVIGALAVGVRLVSLRAGLVLPMRPEERLRAAAAADPVRTSRVPSSLQVWREPRTLLIGVVALAAALSEGAANNWLSIAMVDGFAQSESVGGIVLGIFIGAMTLVRIVGTRLVDRFGRVDSLRISGLVAIVGLAGLGLAPTFEWAVAGAAAWGVGAALCFPIAVAAASDEPAAAGARVSVMASLATVSTLVAPPVLGLAAGAVGARHALLLVLIVLVASVAVAGRVAPPVAPRVAPVTAGPRRESAVAAPAAVAAG